MAHAQTSSLAKGPRGLSTMDTVVTMGLLALLIGISFAVVSSGRRERSRVLCATNLHSIGQAFMLYTSDNSDTFPAPTADAEWEDLLRKYVDRRIFHCPADSELFTQLGSSYDWRDTGDPATTLANRNISQIVRNDAVMAFDALPGWHMVSRVQVVRIDGSTELMNQKDYYLDMQQMPARH